MDERLKALLADIRNLYSGAKIYLFGSQSTGKARPESDFDLIVISSEFKKTDFVDRPGHIWLRSDVIIPADLLCYTPEEFKRISKTSVILRDAMKHAVLL